MGHRVEDALLKHFGIGNKIASNPRVLRSCEAEQVGLHMLLVKKKFCLHLGSNKTEVQIIGNVRK